MASNNNTTTNSTAGLAIDWANFPPIPVDCEKCGVAFDAVDEAHSHRCSICQDLFGSDEPADPSAAAGTSSEEEEKRKCGLCKRVFRPTEETNGVHCSWCCNKWARNGQDIFAPYGKQMSEKAREYLHQCHQRLAMPAIAPIALLPSFVPYNPPTAPTTSARHATTAPKRRKRAAESANEQVSQQNEPTAKRSKTSQQQATTMQNTQTAQPFGLPRANPEDLSESDRFVAEFLERNPTIPTGLEDITQPWTHYAEHPETLPTNEEQTTQPGEDDKEFRNLLWTAIKEMDEQATK